MKASCVASHGHLTKIGQALKDDLDDQDMASPSKEASLGLQGDPLVPEDEASQPCNVVMQLQHWNVDCKFAALPGTAKHAHVYVYATDDHS